MTTGTWLPVLNEVEKASLRERQMVDRAKALLMRQRRLSEPEAYRWLQRWQAAGADPWAIPSGWNIQSYPAARADVESTAARPKQASRASVSR